MERPIKLDPSRRPANEAEHRASAAASSQAEPQGCAPIIVRLVWMAGGNLALLGFASQMARQPPWTISWIDVAYWVVVGAMVAFRYIDVSRFRGDTTDGKPATMADFRKYAVGLPVVAALLWAGTHLVEM